MFKILVVEDDHDLNRTVCSFLNQNGYSCTGCLNAEQAYSAMEKNIFDIIISDIMMPGTSGFEFANTVRSTDSQTPILFMTARDDITSKQLGYLAGIDDYMVKPIELKELILRIEALLRRAKIASSRQLVIGNFKMDMDERTATLDGKEIPMTAREFNLLYKLLSYPRRTFTRSQLMDEFWDVNTTSSPRTVDVYITKIREKLADCTDIKIVTVHGLGYKVIINEE
ncbi:MAG: response regulator transcription factor [Acutalibacteraceae bacterium]